MEGIDDHARPSLIICYVFWRSKRKWNVRSMSEDQKSAHFVIAHIAHASWLSRCLHAIARLGVADVIGDEPKSYENVAHAVGADPKSLHRALRCLVAYGVFRESEGWLSHTHASRLLRKDHPSSQASIVKWAGSPIQWRALGELERVLRTGEPALGQGGLFGALMDEPNEANEFDGAMESQSLRQVQAIADGFNFSTCSRICDVGGGRGHLLAAILKIAPHSKGILVDLPSVIERLDPPTSDRIEHVSRDIFADELPPADAYVMKNVLHDWPDEDAVRILNQIRSSAEPKAKIIIVETLLPDIPQPTSGPIQDLAMLVLNGGQERTLREFDEILDKAELRRTKLVDLHEISLIVAEKA